MSVFSCDYAQPGGSGKQDYNFSMHNSNFETSWGNLQQNVPSIKPSPQLQITPFSDLTTKQLGQLYEQEGYSKKLSYEKLNELASYPIIIDENEE